MNTGVMQLSIPSPLLYNILFDFIIKKVINEAGVSGVKFSYGSNDFFHGKSERYSVFDILRLLYADALVVMCETISDIEKFIRSFEKMTQHYGLTMHIKKTCFMSLKQLKENQHKQVLIGQNISVRNQNIETVDSFTYLGHTITNDQRENTEISVRHAKLLKLLICHTIQYRFGSLSQSQCDFESSEHVYYQYDFMVVKHGRLQSDRNKESSPSIINVYEGS